MGGFRLHATVLENHWGREERNDHSYHYVLRTRNLIPGQIANAMGDKNSNYWSQICRQTNSLGGAGRWGQVRELSEEEFSQVEFEPQMIWKGVLTFNAFKRALNERLMRFPLIEKNEIDDKSKGDAVSKGIALLQLTWFIIQIIVRATQGLAITELELTTAALAGLNSVMYFFWWSKPRDVQCPVVILTYGAEKNLSKTQDDLQWSIPKNMDYDFQVQLWASLTSSIKGVFKTITSFPVSMWKKITPVSEALGHSTHRAENNCSCGAKVCHEFGCHHHTSLLIDGLLDFRHPESPLQISNPLT